MAFNFGEGLAAMGEAVGKFAGTAALEEQRAKLQRDSVILSDQLASERESRGRQETHALNLETLDKTQTFTAGENEKNRAADLQRTNISAGAGIRAAQIQKETQIELQRMKDSADPETAKLAKALEKFTPEQWDALHKFQEIQRDKKSAPAHEFGWEPDPDNPGGMRPKKGGPHDPDQIARAEAAKQKPQVEYREVNGKVVAINKTTGEVTALPVPGAEKALDNSARDDLAKIANPARAMTNLVKGFDDNFAGYKAGILGDLVSAYGRNVSGADSPAGKQAAWWQEYQDFANLKRNQLFGASLTPGEKAEFDKAMVNPNMTPDQVKRNLTRQRDVALNALSRMAHGMKADGYNPKSIEVLIGVPFAKLPAPVDYDEGSYDMNKYLK